jgi:hypothetical protein
VRLGHHPEGHVVIGAEDGGGARIEGEQAFRRLQPGAEGEGALTEVHIGNLHAGFVHGLEEAPATLGGGGSMPRRSARSRNPTAP